MRFTVVWSSFADEQLADAWLDSVDQRDQIAGASHQIDRLLCVDPQGKGQAYDDDRTLEVPPLTVVFSVEEDDRIVRILVVRVE